MADYSRIVEAEGYAYEDLNENNKNTMNWLNWFKDQIVDYLESEYCVDPEDGILERAAKEIISDVIEDLKDHLTASLNEIQVGLIESQEDV